MGSEADSKYERHMSATQVSFEKKSETGVKARCQTEKITFSEIVTSGHEGTVHTDLASETCLLYTSPSPRDLSTSRMPSSA